MKSKLLTFFALLIFLSISVNLWAQTNKQLYLLGVHMGLASFQASVAFGEKNNVSIISNARYFAGIAMKDGIGMINQINTTANYHPPFLEIEGLQNLYKKRSQWSFGNDAESYRFAVLEEYNGIVSLREGYTAQLSKYTGLSNLVHAYTMGVNIAIAEGQATVGEAARQIVYASLVNAKAEAQALNLDLGPLNECINLINATTPIAEIYTKIVSMRSTYQSSL